MEGANDQIGPVGNPPIGANETDPLFFFLEPQRVPKGNPVEKRDELVEARLALPGNAKRKVQLRRRINRKRLQASRPRLLLMPVLAELFLPLVLIHLALALFLRPRHRKFLPCLWNDLV